MHSGLAMDLSGLQQRGLRRTGWPGKTPASPDFPFHPVAWQCGREPESNESAAYSRARRSGKQGKCAGASGQSVLSISHPTRRERCGWLRIGRHQLRSPKARRSLPSFRGCGGVLPGARPSLPGCLPSYIKIPPVNGFSLTSG